MRHQLRCYLLRALSFPFLRFVRRSCSSKREKFTALELKQKRDHRESDSECGLGFITWYKKHVLEPGVRKKHLSMLCRFQLVSVDYEGGVQFLWWSQMSSPQHELKSSDMVLPIEAFTLPFGSLSNTHFKVLRSFWDMLSGSFKLSSLACVISKTQISPALYIVDHQQVRTLIC